MKACLVELQLLYIYCLCNVHRSFFSLSSLLFSYSRWELVKPKEQASSALTGSMRRGERREKKSSYEHCINSECIKEARASRELCQTGPKKPFCLEKTPVTV
jgi:hypothetical protein